jgi:hypothetical protein
MTPPFLFELQDAQALKILSHGIPLQTWSTSNCMSASSSQTTEALSPSGRHS